MRGRLVAARGELAREHRVALERPPARIDGGLDAVVVKQTQHAPGAHARAILEGGLEAEVAGARVHRRVDELAHPLPLGIAVAHAQL